MKRADMKFDPEIADEAVALVKLVKETYPNARCYVLNDYNAPDLDVLMDIVGITREQYLSLDTSGFKHLLFNMQEMLYRGVYVDVWDSLSEKDLKSLEELEYE